MIVPDVKPILNPYLAMTSEKYLKEVTVGPVSAMPFDDNAASCRILENCGFSLEAAYSRTADSHWKAYCAAMP